MTMRSVASLALRTAVVCAVIASVGLPRLVHTHEAGKLEACTAFVLSASGGPWLGKNLDWAFDEGILAVNERGVLKRGWQPEGISDFSWVSRFGSVTFNQFGWGFPLGGINEAGLVVEELSYSPARYPPADDRSGLTELQWIQFQLDNSASVEEVLASDTLVRIDGFLFGLHYMVADPSGSVAVIEFLEGRRVVYRGEDLPVPVLANDTYRNLLRYLALHQGFGGSRIVSDGPESPERFVRAATLLKQYAEWEDSRGPEAAAFRILESVRQPDTQWTLVYDLKRRAASFISPSFPTLRSVALDTLDFSCRPADVMLPLSAGVPTLPPGSGRPWSDRENQELLERVFSRLEALLGPEEIPAAEVIADLARHPATAVCAPGHTDPLNPGPPPPRSG
jgi:penicillin V acylase-like amidase (Ntn superfamily)